MTDKSVDKPSREFWLQLRQSLLMAVDAIERFWAIEPRTSELRKERKGNRE